MPSGPAKYWSMPLQSGTWKLTAFVLAVLMVFIGMIAAALERERRAAEDQAMINSGTLARAAEEHAVATVRAIDQILINIARDYRRDPQQFDFHYWVENSALMLQSKSTELGIATENGTVVLNNTDRVGYNVADREHFIVQRDRVVDGLFISRPLLTRGMGGWRIIFTRRLERPDGTFAGVVAFGLDPNDLADFYQSILVGKQGAIALIGLDGVIRARLVGSDRSIGQSLGHSELLANVETEQAGHYRIAYRTDGIERLVSYRRLREYPLLVNVGFSTEEVLGPYKRFRRQVLAGAAAIGILALTIAMILIREIARRQDGERMLKTVVEAAPATIQLTDNDLRVLWTNRAYAMFVARNAGNADASRPDCADLADRDVLLTGRTVTDIGRFYPPAGDQPEQHMLLTKTPIFDRNGVVTHILTVGTDVTALRRAESEAAAAREAERAAETARTEVSRLLSGMPTVVYRGTISPNGQIALSFVSDNVETITGRSVDGVSDPTGWYDHLGPSAKPNLAAFFARVLSMGESQTEYRLPGPAGVWIRDRARVVQTLADRSEIVGNWTDITREQTLTRQAMESAKLATLGELATGLAHELNQPIAVMSLAAENADDALSTGVDGIPDARTRLSRIIEQAQRAKRIVDHLRIFGRSDTGPIESVELADAVEGALALAGGRLRMDGIAVDVDLPSDLPPVGGRLVLIESVIVNLCVNACDAMQGLPAERKRLRIDAAARPNGWIALRVTDEGGGVPDSAMPRLFEPFFTTKPPGQGTGLGLSISHGMMQSMGGSLSVANTGQGACFTLTLRAVTPETEPNGGTRSLAAGIRGTSPRMTNGVVATRHPQAITL